MMRALLLALALAACATPTPPELPPPQMPQRAGVDPIVAARAEGVVLLASGAGFELRIFNDNRIALVWDGGAPIAFPSTAPMHPAYHGEVYVAAAEGRRVSIEIRYMRCDGAGDETYTARVVVEFEGVVREGCGRRL